MFQETTYVTSRLFKQRRQSTTTSPRYGSQSWWTDDHGALPLEDNHDEDQQELPQEAEAWRLSYDWLYLVADLNENCMGENQLIWCFRSGCPVIDDARCVRVLLYNVVATR